MTQRGMKISRPFNLGSLGQPHVIPIGYLLPSFLGLDLTCKSFDLFLWTWLSFIFHAQNPISIPHWHTHTPNVKDLRSRLIDWSIHSFNGLIWIWIGACRSAQSMTNWHSSRPHSYQTTGPRDYWIQESHFDTQGHQQTSSLGLCHTPGSCSCRLHALFWLGGHQWVG